ncbi:MAG: recombinase family protein [Oscillospiraceae bacterium]|nr:recombinase family protein [Oscillospiraceae bacterium]
METAIYVRVSTEEQAKEGYSIRGQQQRLTEYARIKGWQIFDVYADEGISGKNIAARPAINRLIGDVGSGLIKNVLVFKIDRLTRSTGDLIYLVDLFNQHDCAFNSLMESLDTATASGRMFLKIIGIFAEFERENIAERIILGRDRKVREGYTLCSYLASYGYDRPGGQKIQTVNEGEAQIVREIFDLYVNQGITMTEMARRLNLRGIPTKQNTKWNTTGIRNILKNSNYTGDVRHHYLDGQRAYTAAGRHEQIVSKELFDQARRRLEKNTRMTVRKPPKEENYFAGFLICAACGHKLNAHNIYKTTNGTTHFFGNYGCANPAAGGCDAGSVSANKLARAFREYTGRLADFESGGAGRFYEREKEKKERERQALTGSCEESLRYLDAKAQEALDGYARNIFTVEEYQKIKQRIQSDRQHISAERDRLRMEDEEIPDNTVGIARSFRENWDALSNTEKRQFLMQFVEKITVENKRTGAGHQQKTARIQNIVFREENLE